MVDEMRWVPEPVYRRTVGQLRGWVIALAILMLIGLIVLGVVGFRAVFATASFPVVASSPRDCRLGGDAEDPKLFVAVDVAMIIDGSLFRASSLGPTGLKVEGVGVVSSLAPLADLDDADFVRTVESAADGATMLSEDEPGGVLVAIIDAEGEREGRLDGLRTGWATSGEPTYEQDLALGIDFTPAGCTVTAAGSSAAR